MKPSPATHTMESSPGSKFIMVLDQDEKSRQALEESLEGSGHHTESFHCLSDVQITEFNFAKFDLVICDLDNGLEIWKNLLARIRMQCLDTQLVLSSGKAAEREWLEALQLGVFDLLVKPYSKSEVLRVTGNALAMNYNHRFRTE